ncbi:MAG: hypothetical protein JW919_02555 [Candidatus Omnitrophica bacterium]|nr:hypothetical protein [Candidatus Omnitrophota bacterium]
MEKALEYHDMIPEAVRVYTSVTTKRPGRFNTKIGIFDYRHIRTSLFWGYVSVTLNKQTAFMATPEKALLDLFYLRGVEASGHYLQEMRLQNIEKIDKKKLLQFAGRFQKPKMIRTAAEIIKYAAACRRGEKSL